MNLQKNIIRTFVAAVFLTPLVASAHALPVASDPASSARLDVVPTVLSITFSERVDAAASSITIQTPSGTKVSEPASSQGDGRTLSVPLMDDGKGTYIVHWAVVSADDGHFTKGGYAFSVGAGVEINTSFASEGTEIVKIATVPEALSMTVELVGNGIIWAALLLFAFGIRPLLTRGKFDDIGSFLKRGYSSYLLFGVFLALVGALLQLVVKGNDLASLQSILFWQAVPLYIQTAAGNATVWRIGAIVCVLIIFLLARTRILRAIRITPYEIVLMACMCVFAYFRAKISHATANPFHPEFSIAVNFFHLIEKDVWAGIVGALVILAVVPRTRSFLLALLPRASHMLALDFAAVSVTACYIVWLHLKSFSNIFTTEWGGVFLQLLLIAVLMVGMRFYHVCARLLAPRAFTCFLAPTLAIEFAFAMLVVFCSSVVIITSPPLIQPHTNVFSTRDQSVAITLQRDLFEDGMLLLNLSGDKLLQEPTVTSKAGDSSEVTIELTKRFEGGYVFPQALLAQGGPFKVSVTVPQEGAYDAHATFLIDADDFDIPEDYESRRALDGFTVILIVIGVMALIAGALLWYLSGLPSPEFSTSRSKFTDVLALVSFLVAAFLGASLIGTLHGSYLENPFKWTCESDGNMWHTMQPMKAGVPLSSRPAEGCMWGMGKYTYMFADAREYEFNKTLGAAKVRLVTAPQKLVAGAPTSLTVSLKNADGSPATLSVDMEKLVHLVVVSKDQTVFAHIHADDLRPLTQEEIDTSTFNFNYIFPKAGEYLLSFDYAHGISLESKQFILEVGGAPAQATHTSEYPSSGIFGGYKVSLDYSLPIAGNVETLKYTITKDGVPISDIVPYLSAAMHVSVVKNDFSNFLHMHGEVHPLGVPLPPIIVKDGKVVHSMAMMMTPERFSSPIDAHVIFPTAGLYTVWGQFKVGDKVIPTAFTVRVEQ